MNEQLLARAAGEIIDRVGAAAGFAASVLHRAIAWPGPDQESVRSRLGEMDVPADSYAPNPPELAYTMRLADGSPLTLTPTNTELVTFDAEPYLDHVRVTHRTNNEREVYRFYENPGLMAGLAASEFPIVPIHRIMPRHREQYAQWFTRNQSPAAIDAFLDSVLPVKP